MMSDASSSVTSWAVTREELNLQLSDGSVQSPWPLMPTRHIVFSDQHFAMEFTGVQRDLCVEINLYKSNQVSYLLHYHTTAQSK